MPDVNIPSPVLGIDVRQSANLIDDHAAADGTQNVDFDAGVVSPPYGFAKLSGLLESGEGVFGITQYNEVNGRVSIVAATTTKIHEHNPGNDVWDEISGDTIDVSVQFPVSMANIYHQTAISGKNQHLVICDGGRSELIRWPGHGNTLSEVAGGTGYNGAETGHRALQVVAFHERCILISPYTYTGGAWLYNQSQVRYPQLGQLESWTGTGSGTIELVDTGDVNVRAQLLGSVLIIYQTRSTWQLRHVGGSTVFSPDVLLPTLGLLSYQLLVSTGNVHFFVGTDYNIYQFSLGGLKQIGQEIADAFRADISTALAYAGRMAFDSQRRHLWIFIPTGTEPYCVKAYKYNMRNGSWTVRDFSAYYTTGGISATVLLPSGIYTAGDSYADAVAAGTTYAVAVTAATTYAGTFTEVRLEERLSIGDDNGYVLQEDATITADDGTEPTHRYITKEFDGGAPDINKRIEGIQVDAKGTSVTIEYRKDDGSWMSLTVVTLDSTFSSYKRFINRSFKKIQFRLSGVFTLRSFKLFNVQPEASR